MGKITPDMLVSEWLETMPKDWHVHVSDDWEYVYLFFLEPDGPGASIVKMKPHTAVWYAASLMMHAITANHRSAEPIDDFCDLLSKNITNMVASVKALHGLGEDVEAP